MELAAVLLLTLAAAILFATQVLRVDVVAILILVTLAVSGLLSPEDALSGFSNSATATVAAMFIMAGALKSTGVTERIAAALGGAARRSPFLLYPSLLVLAAIVSGFINNTAAVAVFIPVVLGLIRKHGGSPSRFLMPLSFAAQAGGVCTLIGTSTNILVSEIATRDGFAPFGMFELSGLGICFLLVTLAYLIFGAPFLLPKETSEPKAPLSERYELHQYLAELEVPEGSEYVGKRLVDAELEKRLDIEVLEILRAGKRRWLPDPEERLCAGDVLLVRGPISELLKTRSLPGLQIKRDLHDGGATLEGEDVILVEAVVPPGSPLIGTTLKRNQFRRRHRSQVLAIRHHEQLQRRKVGQVLLDVGDVLLLQGHRPDLEEMRNGTEVILMEEAAQPRSWKHSIFAVAVIASVVITAALGWAPILVTAIAGSAALVLGRALTVEQAYEAIDWRVIFLIAGVIPLGKALEQSGGAEYLAGGLSHVFEAFGPVALLSAFFLVTTLMTQLMSNSATAAMLAPLAIATAVSVGIDPRPLLVAITVAASTCFMSPLGYQTNAMVMGPGGYSFADFLRVGTPLNVVLWILGTILIPIFFPF
jgi:di/tricarboxylate transporter